MAFTVEIATLDGLPRGQPAFRDLVLERALNGGTTVAFTIDQDDATAAEVLIGDRAVRLWEDGALRFHGKLREPLVSTPGKLAVTAGSPFTLLDRRQLQAARTFTQVDQGLIVATLLGQENARSPTRLRMGSYPLSVKRDRSYEPGKSLAEIVEELAAVIGGFYFVETAVVDLATHDFAELVLRYPDPGVVRPEARFEYGEGTVANLVAYTLTQTLPLNAVTYVGADATNPALKKRATDATSIARYDLIEAWFSDPDVSVPSTLQEKADERLQPLPSHTVEVAAVATGPALGAPPSPRLWRDFDVGDTVSVSIRDDATEVYALPGIVTAASLQLSAEDDSETLALTFQAPDAEARSWRRRRRRG